MTTRAAFEVEQAAIEAAEAYARANGFTEGLHYQKAAGLVLVGMAIMAACDEHTQLSLLQGYREAFPEAHGTLHKWVTFLEEAGRR